jgi:hypothetical protein
LRTLQERCATAVEKVFWLFSSEKNCLPYGTTPRNADSTALAVASTRVVRAYACLEVAP